MTSELLSFSLLEARNALIRREFSSTELTEAYIAAMFAARPLNAFITETPEIAIEKARISDSLLSKGKGGILEGIPIAVKDLFCTKGIRTTAGSKILSDFIPPYESAVTEKLWRCGAICLGKLNLDQFGMGSSSTESHFGPVISPWTAPGSNIGLVAGGSSGGSAAAVAANAALASIGTDTGGSIRQPAAFCGIVGLKPTYGRCSRWGIVAYASSLDQAGPMTRTVADAAIMLKAMSGHDPRDSTSSTLPVPDFESALTGDLRGVRVGVPKECRVDGIPSDIERLWQRGHEMLSDAGAIVKDVSLPMMKYALPAYYIIALAEASSNLARYDGVRFGLRTPGRTLDEMYKNTRADGFGAEVRRRILIGTYVLSAGYYDAYYAKAQKVRKLIADGYRQAFQDVDVLLTPTTPSSAFSIGQKSDDPVAMYLSDIFTVPVNLAGLPAMSVPAGGDGSGLPLGLQVIGRPFEEETVIRVGRAIEIRSSFREKPRYLAG